MGKICEIEHQKMVYLKIHWYTDEYQGCLSCDGVEPVFFLKYLVK